MISERIKKAVNVIVLFLFIFVALFFLYGVATGLPVNAGEWTYRAKNFKGLILIALSLWALHLTLHPQGPIEGVLRFKRITEHALQHKSVAWILFALFGLLFTWQQVAEYLSLEINFLPFSFYDYMLQYFLHGKIHFTGWLHGFYHHNLILFLLAPLWKVFQSPLLLILSYGFIASACVFPLYAIARERLKDYVTPFVVALVFLNYRYLQNVLLMNFSVEIFFPLCIFSAVYFSIKRKWALFYLFLFLQLLVKEDSFVYGAAISLITFFYRDEANSNRSSRRLHATFSLFIAVGYYAFLKLIYSDWIHSDIMYGNAANYAGHGGSFEAMILKFLKAPWLLFHEYFGSGLKIGVLFKVLSRVAFLPLFTPAIIPFLIALAPLFLHSTGQDNDFFELRFYYVAAVLPFIFIATIFGLSNFLRLISRRWVEWVRWALCLLMIALNVGSFRTEKFTSEDIQSIKWAREIPPGVVVTHGHLLPYIGYREQNFYFAEPFALIDHPAHLAYSNPDYISIDLNVNLYPMNRSFFDSEIQKLKSDSRFKLIKQDRELRFLFKASTPRAISLPKPGYRHLSELVLNIKDSAS